MKKNISKKSGLVSALIIAVIISVLATTFAVFAEENTPEETSAVMTTEVNDNNSEAIENNSEEVTEENDSAEEAATAEDDSTEEAATAENDSAEEIEEDNNSEEPAEEDNNSIEPSSNETLSTDEITNENLESQEDLVELAEEIPTAEDQIVADETILNCESVHYNAIYLGGLNINNINWDHIVITVKDAKTGESHEGYLEYQNNNALLGFLTTGCFMDTNCAYTIEVQIHMPNEEVMIINGSSTGAASNGNGYSTISFAAEGHTEI